MGDYLISTESTERKNLSPNLRKDIDGGAAAPSKHAIRLRLMNGTTKEPLITGR